MWQLGDGFTPRIRRGPGTGCEISAMLTSFFGCREPVGNGSTRVLPEETAKVSPKCPAVSCDRPGLRQQEGADIIISRR